jgi:hypothetical protein
MALENRWKKILFGCLWGYCSLAYTATLLPELATKQPIQNLRYMSNDGIITYFQNRRGKLLYSSNYNIATVLEKKENTQFTIHSSNTNKYLLIESEEDYFEIASFQQDHDIYSLLYNQTQPTFLGKGVSPMFHENGLWSSYYSFMQHVLTFVNLEAPLIKTKIKIANTVFPYFIPQALLFNRTDIFYTDTNKKGEQGIIYYNRESRKKKLFLQTDIFGQTFQLCQNDTDLFILQTGQDQLHSGTQIYKMSKKDPIDIKSLKSIYTSTLNDIGNMICDFNKEYILFTKTKKSNKYAGPKNVVAQLNLKDNKIEIIYDQEHSFNLFVMDKKVLLSTQGKYYILKGNKKLKDDSIK